MIKLFVTDVYIDTGGKLRVIGDPIQTLAYSIDIVRGYLKNESLRYGMSMVFISRECNDLLLN